jgi:tetratricopeptide (TPR) repeat protein
MESLREAAVIRSTQLQIMVESGDRNGVGTALMEHASTLVNLASAGYVNKEYEEARQAYETAMGVFELMEDFDKLSRCLMNLSNMHELQLSKKAEACVYRKKLVGLYKEHMPERAIPCECPVCLEALDVDEETSDEHSIMILGCYHMLHNSCWDKWCAEKGEGAECPHCKQPVPLFN